MNGMNLYMITSYGNADSETSLRQLGRCCASSALCSNPCGGETANALLMGTYDRYVGKHMITDSNLMIIVVTSAVKKGIAVLLTVKDGVLRETICLQLVIAQI